jgi:uncharacterized protein (TIGR00297 family)
VSETTRIRKAIPAARDRLQSRLVVACVTPVLVFFAARDWWRAMHLVPEPSPLYVDPASRGIALTALAISACFALIVWRLRSATPAAAALGGVICLLISVRVGVQNGSILRSGLPPLFVLFVLTFLATRAGRARKASLGLAEAKRGRNVAQVIANLGMAGLVAGFPGGLLKGLALIHDPRSGMYPFYTSLCLVAVLCEATADTLASEIGQAFGGTPFLVTTLRRVPAGTDGAISLQGTIAALLGTVCVALAGKWSLGLDPFAAGLAAASGIAGLFFDSLLGVTLERFGLLGNDLVNFVSTCSAVCFVGLFLDILRL